MVYDLAKAVSLNRISTAIARIGRRVGQWRILCADAAVIDTAMASALNLLSLLIIGAVFGVASLGEFSMVLIYSSFVYLFTYNFIIIPATSKASPISDDAFARKVIVISLVAFVPLALTILLLDKHLLRFSSQSALLTFIYIFAHNAFQTMRRVVLHLRLSRFPALFPLVSLLLLSALAMVGVVSYHWFVLLYSLSFLAVVASVILRAKGGGLFPDMRLALQFLKFSRWMVFGVWFQWLSGNLVQLLVQYHEGPEGLGGLRVLLSSFGLVNIFIQYQEIALAREHSGSKAVPRFELGSVLRIRTYLVPVTLIVLSLPIYLTYCYVVGVPPLLQVAVVFSIYQFFLSVTIVMRVYLRLMDDLLYQTVGYVLMVAAVLLVEFLFGDAFSIMVAMLMYLASVGVMVCTLAIGMNNVSSKRI